MFFLFSIFRLIFIGSHFFSELVYLKRFLITLRWEIEKIFKFEIFEP